MTKTRWQRSRLSKGFPSNFHIIPLGKCQIKSLSFHFWEAKFMLLETKGT